MRVNLRNHMESLMPIHRNKTRELLKAGGGTNWLEDLSLFQSHELVEVQSSHEIW